MAAAPESHATRDAFQRGGAPPAGAVRCLKAAGPRSVWQVRGPEGDLRTRKTWPLDALSVAKWLCGGTQAQRHAKAVATLAAAGIRTPRVVAGPRWRREPWGRAIELELAYVEGRTGLEVLRDGDSECAERAAVAVAELLEMLIRGRIFNRDLKLSNVLVEDRDGVPRAWLLDPVALRPLRAPRSQVARMLERLAVEPREQGIRIPPQAARRVVHAARKALGLAPEGE